MLNPLTLEQLDEEMQEKEQQPPLSIASRRKSSSMLVIVMSVVCAAIVALLLFFGLDKSSEDKAKPQQEAAGRIELRAVNAYFVKNSTAGELLVISGEAVNSFEAPRASIQVKGIVYGDANKVLISKNAYAGNPLSREQLAAMPLDKIETTMSNQFGDSLANMGVAPGKGIPFVVIIPQVPADAREYGLELVGSTGADPKK